MKKAFLLIAIAVASLSAVAQTQSVEQLQSTARSFIKQGDYANAILVLKRALEQAPANSTLIKELAMSYYYNKDNPMAMETINKIVDKDDIDDQTIQVAGLIYSRNGNARETEKLYRKALKKFPESGPLYNELGEVLWAQKNYDAIKQWEKGIEVDPSYSRNYYNAAKFYYLSTDKVWSILYSEIFINMDPNGSNTAEMKQILLDSYKKLFSNSDIEKGNTEKMPFAKSFLKEMNKQSGIVAAGIYTESLAMIRARFILDWFANTQNEAFKYRLFSMQQQLLRDGLFDAYNQWLFGSTQNLTAFQNWVNANANTYNEFLQIQKSRVFKMPKGATYK